MKNKIKKNSNKSLNGANEGFGDIRKGKNVNNNSVVVNNHSSVGHNRAAVVNNRQSVVSNTLRVVNNKASVVHNAGLVVSNKVSVAHNERKEIKNKEDISFLILLAITGTSTDFLPRPDGEFDEWQKNFVKVLGSIWPPDGAVPGPLPSPAPPAAASADDARWRYERLAQHTPRGLPQNTRLHASDAAFIQIPQLSCMDAARIARQSFS